MFCVLRHIGNIPAMHYVYHEQIQTWISPTVIAKIKAMPRSLFYDMQCYVTMIYERYYTPLLLAQREKKRAFESQNRVNLI